MQQPYVYAYPAVVTPPAPVAGTGFPIVDPRYYAPYPVVVGIVQKVMKLTEVNFVVTDVNGNLLFKVKAPLFGLHDRRILLDASDSPVVTLRRKAMSLHYRWQVFRGGSMELGDLLYTVKRPSVFQFKIELDVFLASNKEEKICDYKIQGNWVERSCVVYAGESDDIVAQMHRKQIAQSIILGKDNFSVTISPNVDQALIVSLFVIVGNSVIVK